MKHFTKEKVFELAKEYLLEAEVRYAIEKAGLTPNEALNKLNDIKKIVGGK